jgi:SHS2 domain-containing protein
MDAPGTHSFEEHTGELKIRLEAPTLRGLFAEAGRALAEVMGGRPLPRSMDQAEKVHVLSTDRDALLVDFLNELLYRCDREKKLYADLAIDELSDTELSATVWGHEAEELRTQVKAATFHGLAITEGPDGFTARLVLDV